MDDFVFIVAFADDAVFDDPVQQVVLEEIIARDDFAALLNNFVVA